MATPTNMAQPPETDQQTIQPVAPPAPPPHGQLLNMIQGLAVGLGAFGKSIATGGREGGVADVQSYQEKQQAMDLREQENQRAQQRQTQELSESQARVAYNRASTNHMILQDQINLQKAPDEIQMAHTLNQKAMIDLYKEAGLSPMAAVLMIQGQDPQVHMQAVSSAANGDLVNNTAIPVHDNKAGQGGMTNLFSSDSMSHITFAKDKLAPVFGQESNMLAVTAARLGPDDPSVKQAKVMLEQAQQAPQMNGEDFFRHNVAFTNMLSNAVARKEAMLQSQKEIADTSKAQSEAVKSGAEAAVAAPLNAAKLTEQQAKASTAGPLARAQLSEAQAGATLKTEQAKQLQAQGNLGVTGDAYLQSLDPTHRALVSSIAKGQIEPGRMSYLLSKNPALISEVVQADPTFDTSKVASYASTYKEFTSTKAGTAGGQINAGETALKHLAELKDLNTVASHIPGTPAYNAYNNKADTVASELAKFYGDATIPAIASIKGTLTKTLPGNRDAAIQTQAQSMSDKFDSFKQQWKNAAPSAAYEAKMPYIDSAAQEALRRLDPRQSQQSATPSGADNEVYVSGKLVGHTVAGKYVPLGQ